MTTIRGKNFSKGCGGAGECLKKQLPKISESFPEFSTIHCGTINVLLERPLLVFKPDHRTPPIDWLGDGSHIERFDLVGVRFEVKGKIHDGWLYVPQNGAYRQKPTVHEFILRERIDIQDGVQCSVHIDRECFVALNGVVGVF
jgi:hypothetical protein